MMRRRPTAVVGAGVLGAVLLGTGLAAAAAAVSGSIGGPVTSVKGQTFTLKTSLSPTGSSKVLVSSATVITEQANGSRADLRKGVCAVALGQTNSKGVILATRVMLSAPVKGKCGGGFGGGGPRGGGNGPGGQLPPQTGSRQRPGFSGNVGFASGAITAVAGSTITLHSSPQGTSSMTVSSKTQFLKTIDVTASAVRVGHCAFVQGTSTDKGVTVTAQDVRLSKPGPNGCTATFRGP